MCLYDSVNFTQRRSHYISYSVPRFLPLKNVTLILAHSKQLYSFMYCRVFDCRDATLFTNAVVIFYFFLCSFFTCIVLLVFFLFRGQFCTLYFPRKCSISFFYVLYLFQFCSYLYYLLLSFIVIFLNFSNWMFK